jgi:hypothetical protein
VAGCSEGCGARLNGEYGALDVGAQDGVDFRLWHVTQLGRWHDACVAAQNIYSSEGSNGGSGHALAVCGLSNEARVTNVATAAGSCMGRGVGDGPCLSETSPTKGTTRPPPRDDSSSAHAVTEREVE